MRKAIGNAKIFSAVVLILSSHHINYGVKGCGVKNGICIGRRIIGQALSSLVTSSRGEQDAGRYVAS